MEKAKSQINFNTVVSFVILAVVVWVGASIQQHSAKLAEISQDVAVLKNTVDTQGKEQVSQGNSIAQIQYELARRTVSPPRPK